MDKIRTIASLSNIYINENFDESYLDSKILTEYFEEDYLSSLKLDDSELISSSLCIF
ncbi:DNA mismatch repair mutS domain protein [[Clostridium] sordellii ATCC 9714]|nr:DNA mismatch repair mutS domain protein [[Clostridium] sordellii ATCC 9714] [Paeniclostridium sordellii ATCC 9714]